MNTKVDEKERAAEISRLREEIEALSAIHRPSASEGESEAAEWIGDRFRDLGLQPRIEEEPAHGTYWYPMGISAAIATVGGMAALRGRRGIGALLGTLGAASIWDDVNAGKRPLRRALSNKKAYNVIAELGPKDAERTVVFMSHHDAAHSGLIFHPEIPKKLEKAFPGAVENMDTSPPLMWSVVAGPMLVALGSVLNRRGMIKAGTAISVLTQLVMAEIGSREVVPGANDNASGVVSLFSIARAFQDRPPENLKIILFSAGAEESFLEGSKAFLERHRDSLPKESTFFVCVDGVASPHLNYLEGEGMMKMCDYPEDAKQFVRDTADELGIDILSGLRLRNSTDGLVPLRAGYKSVCIASCTDLKAPVNYHWPTDTPDALTYETMHDATRLLIGMVNRLDSKWLW